MEHPSPKGHNSRASDKVGIVPMSTPDPFERFQEIFSNAWKAGIKNAHAMTLSTVDDEGQPSSRQVLLKNVDRNGFVFYTNLESRKGTELLADPRASLNFYWRELDQQVSVRGSVLLVTDEEADAYFDSRDRGSQLGAWASQQSRPLQSRARLVADVAKVEARYLGRRIPRPPHWTGFRLVPIAFDFWTARRFRLHDRILYELIDGEWKSHRAYP